MMSPKVAVIFTSLLFAPLQVVAEPRTLEVGEIGVNCLYLSSPANCSIYHNLGEASTYEVQKYDLSSLAWLTIDELKNKDEGPLVGLELGALYRVLSCRGESGCRSSNMVWLPEFLASWDELPEDVEVPLPDGTVTYGRVSKHSFDGTPYEDLRFQNVQYNVYLLDRYLVTWIEYPEVFDDLPALVDDFAETATPAEEDWVGALTSHMANLMEIHREVAHEKRFGIMAP